MNYKPTLWLFVLLSVLFGILGCISTGTGVFDSKPPETFKETDVIGVWKTEQGSETLALSADYIYEQTYDDGSIDYHREGAWSIEYRDTGCVYLHLEGMRYFYLTRSAAENGNRYPDGTLISFWEPCEERLVTMPDKVILLVGSHSDFPRGIKLEFLLKEEGTDIWLYLSDRE